MNTPSPSPRPPGMRFLLRWGPSVFWGALIFAGSTDAMSAEHTSRYVEPFLRWIWPGISQPTVELLHAVIRKGGHVTEYAIFALLLRSALQPRQARNGGKFCWKTAAVALMLATVYAASDEFHQSFVPSRGAAVSDVMIDMCGAALGLAICLAATAWGGRLTSKPNSN